MFRKKTNDLLVKQRHKDLQKQKEEMQLLEESRTMEAQFEMFKAFKRMEKEIEQLKKNQWSTRTCHLFNYYNFQTYYIISEKEVLSILNDPQLRIEK